MLSFDELLSTELEVLTRYARALSGNREDAHDLLADVLVAAHQRWDRIGPLDNPVGYVRSMLTNRFLDAQRQRKRRSVLLLRTARERPAAVATNAAVDDRSQLHDLLATLPAKQRAAVVLRYYLDLPDAVIADELGLTASSVRSMTSRALASIRERAISESNR